MNSKKSILARMFGARSRHSIAIAGCLSIAGCGTAPDRAPLLDRTLGAVGLQRAASRPPAMSAGSLPPFGPIPLRLHAGEALNSDAGGRPLSVVAKLYALRAKESFENAPWEAFLAQDKDAAFARDIVGVREVTLVPGRTYASMESLPPEASYFAVVALFRQPAEHRWRFVFASPAAAKSGLSLAVHACAMSVSVGQALGPEAGRPGATNGRCPALGDASLQKIRGTL